MTVSVLIVQMATGTFSARYMRIFYRDRAFKAVLGVLIGTFTFSYTLMRHVEDDAVPDLGVTLAGAFLGLGILLFVIFLDRAIHRLRPVAVASLVAKAEAARRSTRCSRRPHGRMRRTRRGRRDRRRIRRRAAAPSNPTGPDAENRLRSMVALGVERTIEQDPSFAIRIMVDIAIRALSPAVNDPTTAVQVLDHLEDLLRLVGQTDLSDEGAPLEDLESGLVVPVRRWSDYVTLSVTEIREYGATSIQVVRRMRAMLEELSESVLPERREAVLGELATLEDSVEASWGATVDDDLARRADRQGIGGPSQAIGLDELARDDRQPSARRRADTRGRPVARARVRGVAARRRSSRGSAGGSCCRPWWWRSCSGSSSARRRSAGHGQRVHRVPLELRPRAALLLRGARGGREARAAPLDRRAGRRAGGSRSGSGSRSGTCSSTRPGRRGVADRRSP